MNVTVYDKKTKKVIASIDTESRLGGFCTKDVDICISEYEPLFKNIDGVLYFLEDKFVVKI